MVATWLLRYLPQIAISVVLIAGTVAFHRWSYNRGEAAAEARHAEAIARAADAYAREIERQQGLVEAAEGELVALRAKGDRVRTVVREVYRDNPEAREWRDQPIPGALREAVR